MRLAQVPSWLDPVDETLNAMRAFVRLFKVTDMVRNQAGDLVARVPKKAWILQINAIFTWVQQNIAYVQDVTDVETLQTPEATLTKGYGDCDDQVTLLEALLESVGFHTRSVAVDLGNGFEHVFAQVQLPDQSRWFSLDPTELCPMGWQPPDIVDWKVRDN